MTMSDDPTMLAALVTQLAAVAQKQDVIDRKILDAYLRDDPRKHRDRPRPLLDRMPDGPILGTAGTASAWVSESRG